MGSGDRLGEKGLSRGSRGGEPCDGQPDDAVSFPQGVVGCGGRFFNLKCGDEEVGVGRGLERGMGQFACRTRCAATDRPTPAWWVKTAFSQ